MIETAKDFDDSFDEGAKLGLLDAKAGVFCRFNPQIEDEYGNRLVCQRPQFYSDFARGYWEAYVEYQKEHTDEYQEALYDFKKRLKGGKS